MKVHFLILLFGALYGMSCTSKTEHKTYTKMYDLEFRMQEDSSIVYHWQQNAAYLNYTIPVGVKGVDRPLFAMMYQKGHPFLNRLQTELKQRILLPPCNANQATVEFESKGKNIRQISITLDAINEEEKVIFSDTLKFIPDTALRIVSKDIMVKNAKLLNIRINAEGVVDSTAYIALSKLNLWLDGKPIDSFLVRTLSPFTAQDARTYTPIAMDERLPLDQINEINKKKIIGLGESMHGNDEIKKLGYECILQTAEQQNARLVLLEMPLEVSLACNRYIQDSRYTLDSLFLAGKSTLHLFDFLDKLRLFNSKQTDESKVRLYGSDYNPIYSPTQNSAVDIFDFVTRLNEQAKIPELDQFSLLLMEADWQEASSFLQAHKNEIQKVLTPEEVDVISHILTLSREIGDNPIQRFIRRDSVMFANAKFLIDKYASAENVKTIIYGHAIHINRLSTFPAVPCTSFGYYMQEQYSDAYSPLLILTGEDTGIAYDQHYNQQKTFLHKLPFNSMESFLSTFDENIFYIPLTPEFNRLILSRFKGSHHMPQEFYPFNLYQRYKGIFFIKNLDYDSIDKKEISLDEISNLFMAKTKQRQKKIDEIQKRIKISQSLPIKRQ
ncbi:erythromycin esterase family protein [Tannerella forsythia]|uniref:erythromycin esterase family protein n=2 Tax=Tannerella forsythia TaxID=28112 RepID=UPI000764A6DF|nr:erythromycin esterase family protein [Tannerella forsythia]SCQ20853.1 Erythromycin esterase [Tannerella forsythia]SCQ22561.1 Erythromycin esterase [Tannerella forsythia]